MNTLNVDIPDYFNPLESVYIDQEIKDEFKGKSFMAQEIINMQLIKSMKELTESLHEMPDFTFDSNGNLYTREGYSL